MGSRGAEEGEAEGKTEGLVEGEAEGWAEGEAEGRAEGEAEGLVEEEAEGRVEGEAESTQSWKQRKLAVSCPEASVATFADLGIYSTGLAVRRCLYAKVLALEVSRRAIHRKHAHVHLVFYKSVSEIHIN